MQAGLLRVHGGKADLLKKLPGYNAASRHMHWLILLDLDQEAGGCPALYIRQCLDQERAGKFCLRIAVQALEAWLLADIEQLAAYLGVAAGNFPANPDAEPNPKHTLLEIVRRKCRKAALRSDLLPRPGSGAKVGPAYPGRIQEFVRQSPWRPEAAAKRSDSLRRCLDALNNIKRQGI